MKTTHDVYKGEDNWYFSMGVKREMGVNCCISLHNGEQELSVVMPLKVDERTLGLEKVGTILITD